MIIIPNQPVLMSVCDGLLCNERAIKCQQAIFSDRFHVQLGIINPWPASPKYHVEIRDCCDNLINDLGDSITTSACSDIADVQFTWSDYLSTIGKYKVCIPDVNLLAEFWSAENWEQTGSGTALTYDTGHYDVALDENEESKILSYFTDLDCLKTLEISVGVVNMSTGNTDIHIHVYINDTYFGQLTGGAMYPFDTNDIDLSTYPYHIEKIGIKVIGVADGDVVTIYSIAMPADICSNCFCLNTTADCTLLLESYNHALAGFGFAFPNSTYRFYLRIESEILGLKNKLIETVQENSSGSWQNYFNQIRNSYDLKVYSEPDYVWRAIEMMTGLSNFYINKKRYIKIENTIELNFNRTLQESSGTFMISEQTQNLKNFY